MQKTVRVFNLPGSIVKEDDLQKILSQHFGKVGNGGAEVLKCYKAMGESAVFLTLKVSIEGRL